MKWAIAFLVAHSIIVSRSNANAQMPRPENINIVAGSCAPSSHIAEGPIGTDLTKMQSRFFCNTAAITFFPDYKGHVMTQFIQKEAHHGPSLGFAGRLDSDGVIMQVEKIYFGQSGPTTVSGGICKFFFKGKHMSGVFCGANVDETGRRTVAFIAFDPAPGQ